MRYNDSDEYARLTLESLYDQRDREAQAIADGLARPLERRTEMGTEFEELQEAIGLLTPIMTNFNERLTEAEKRADQAKVDAMRVRTMYEQPMAGARDGVLSRPAGGFESFGELLQVMFTRREDPRLLELQQRALSMGVGAAGGFLVPTEYAEMIASVTPQEAIVRPRAMVLPAGASPDAPVVIPTDDQSGTKGVYSGVEVVWTGEGAEKHETEPALGELTLAPHEVSAYITITDKLLRNAAAAETWVSRKLREAIIAAEDLAFISGNGVGKPLGFLGHASAVNVARAGAGAIAWADIVAMFAAALKRRQAGLAWIGNPTTLPQLMQMVDGGGHLVWMISAREGVPPTLCGIPFLENERQPVLGTAGDLMLVNLQHYAIKDGASLVIEASQGPLFKYNKTVIRAVWNVDGQPTLTTPLLLEDGATTQSPFVVLQ